MTPNNQKIYNAIGQNDIESVKKILNKRPKLCNTYYPTIIGGSISLVMIACLLGHVEILKVLLSCPKIKLNNKNIVYVLEYACDNLYTDIIENILLKFPEEKYYYCVLQKGYENNFASIENYAKSELKKYEQREQNIKRNELYKLLKDVVPLPIDIIRHLMYYYLE